MTSSGSKDPKCPSCGGYLQPMGGRMIVYICRNHPACEAAMPGPTIDKTFIGYVREKERGFTPWVMLSLDDNHEDTHVYEIVEWRVDGVVSLNWLFGVRPMQYKEREIKMTQAVFFKQRRAYLKEHEVENWKKTAASVRNT